MVGSNLSEKPAPQLPNGRSGFSILQVVGRVDTRIPIAIRPGNMENCCHGLPPAPRSETPTSECSKVPAARRCGHTWSIFCALGNFDRLDQRARFTSFRAPDRPPGPELLRFRRYPCRPGGGSVWVTPTPATAECRDMRPLNQPPAPILKRPLCRIRV